MEIFKSLSIDELQVIAELDADPKFLSLIEVLTKEQEIMKRRAVVVRPFNERGEYTHENAYLQGCSAGVFNFIESLKKLSELAKTIIENRKPLE